MEIHQAEDTRKHIAEFRINPQRSHVCIMCSSTIIEITHADATQKERETVSEQNNGHID